MLASSLQVTTEGSSSSFPVSSLLFDFSSAVRFCENVLVVVSTSLSKKEALSLLHYIVYSYFR